MLKSELADIAVQEEGNIKAVQTILERLPTSRMKCIAVYIYAEPSTTNLELAQIRDFLLSHVPSLEVELRGEYFEYHLGGRGELLPSLSKALARAKVRNPTRREEALHPLQGEIDYELKKLRRPGQRSFGLLYDGFKAMRLMDSLLPPQERSLSHIHIAFSNQLLGTWEEGDSRYHVRVNILGYPSLISTTGLIEGPAKPREYYFLKQQYMALGLPDAAPVALDSQFRGRFLEHDDPRLTEVMKGYVMQALFYHLLGEAFCPDPHCRLFNAHWQEEVIQAQLSSPYDFCPDHQEKLRQLKKNLELKYPFRPLPERLIPHPPDSQHEANATMATPQVTEPPLSSSPIPQV